MVLRPDPIIITTTKIFQFSFIFVLCSITKFKINIEQSYKFISLAKVANQLSNVGKIKKKLSITNVFCCISRLVLNPKIIKTTNI